MGIISNYTRRSAIVLEQFTLAHTTKSCVARRVDGYCGSVCHFSPSYSAIRCEQSICSTFRRAQLRGNWDARSRSDYKLAISGLILSSEVRLPRLTVITAVTVISLHPGEGSLLSRHDPSCETSAMPDTARRRPTFIAWRANVAGTPFAGLGTLSVGVVTSTIQQGKSLNRC